MRIYRHLAALILAAISVHAQSPLIRTESRLVLVDAVVTDKKGKPVRDLSAADFRLWEDGQERKLTSVNLESPGRSPDRRRNSYVLMFFDGATTNPGAMAQYRRDASRFVSASAGPDRYVAVAYFTKAMRVAQNFTAVAAPLIRAIDAAPAIGLTPVDRNAAYRPNSAAGVPGIDETYSQNVLFSNLRTAAASMAAIRGRKALVLFTATFPRTPDLDTEINATVAACNRANVIVYVIDSGTVLRNLAERTGGRLMAGGGDLIRELGRVVDEQEEYYLLGYPPPDDSVGNCHALRVKVERPGVAVRARSTYCTAAPPASSAVEKVVEERSHPAGNMTASMQLPYFYRAANLARAIVAMEIAPAGIRFQKLKGKAHAELQLTGVAASADGGVAARFSDTVNLDFDSDKEVAAFLSRPYHYENQFDLAAGRYTFRMTFTAGEDHGGKAELPLVIEPWDSKSLTVSAIAIAAGTRQVLNLSAALDDALLEDRRPLLAGSLETTPSGSNRCGRATPCQAYLEIYEPRLAVANAPVLTLQLRIIDRQTNQQKLDSGPFTVASYIRPGNAVVPVPLTLPVSALAAGSYRIEVRAASGHASALRTVELEVN